jgi:hypothetical protein
LGERFAAFATLRSLPAELTDEFARIAKARNDIFHVRLPRVGTELAVAARSLAENGLEASLGRLDHEGRRPVGPSVRGMSVPMIIRAAAELSDAAPADANERSEVEKDA